MSEKVGNQTGKCLLRRATFGSLSELDHTDFVVSSHQIFR